ncbi:peroxidase 12-like [Prosopis cineraria]|uniref:peroxidase 12-like n=1 Tax=Prosopis cineraria TaxID=364024 RepID=UPI00240F24F0|nr:peroxidase 12-like [Prosopis cineraria]
MLYPNYTPGGPKYDIPFGQRDGLTFASRSVTFDNFPPPTSSTDAILSSLATENLSPTDVIALSGGHAIGISHCTSFADRLYPAQDPAMDKTFAGSLKRTCRILTTDNTTVLDIRSPNLFDNKNYVDLMNRQGLFNSDQDLYTNKRKKGIVTSFAVDQNLFLKRFVEAMLKMGQLSVLTGTQGEVRAKCSVTNKDNASLLASVAEGVVEADWLNM